MSHYETLGVLEGATAEEIKRAYRKLASQHHPDKGGDTAKFQQIEEAYRVLSDTNQRAQYDAQRRGNPGGFKFTVNGQDFDGSVPPGMEDIFSRFGFNFGQGHPFHQPRRNKDLQVAVALDLASTLSDQTKTISVQTTNGDRFTVEVNVPRGVTNGTSIKYSGLGDNFFNTLPRGDLYVEFRIIPHQHINVNGIDLVTAVHIDSLKAIVGGEVTVKGLDGTEFVVAIPKGCQYGTKLRIKGQGLWQVNQPIRGNLIVMVNIVTPTNLSEDQLQDILKISENLSS